MSTPPEETPAADCPARLAPYYRAAPAAYLASQRSATAEPGAAVAHLVASAGVVAAAPAAAEAPPRVLLLQRAAHAFQPLRWELPGGRAEGAKDASVVGAALRELREETGLGAGAGARAGAGADNDDDDDDDDDDVRVRVVDVLEPGYEWLDKGVVWKKVTFLVEVVGGGIAAAGADEAAAQPEERKTGGLPHSPPPPSPRLPAVKLDPREQAAFAWATRDEVLAGRCGEHQLSWTSLDQRDTVLAVLDLAASRRS